MSPDQPSLFPKILVASDGSPTAAAAAEAAIAIARAHQWAIAGLTVIDAPVVVSQRLDYLAETGETASTGASESILAWLRERALAIQRELARRCEEAGVPFAPRVLEGEIAESVEREALQARLLALGRRGCAHGAGQQGRLGENFLRLAQASRLSLLVGGEAPPAFDRLLLAYGGGERAQFALEWAVRLQRAFCSRVSVIAVQERAGAPPPLWIETAPIHLDRSGLTDYELIQCDGDPTERIAGAAREGCAGLVLLGASRRRPFGAPSAANIPTRVLRATERTLLIA